MAQPIWNTDAGSLGTYPSLIPLIIAVSASPVLPAVSLTYSLLSGSLPPGLSITENGVISGTPNLVDFKTTTIFTIRATDNFQNIRDRTFAIDVTGTAIPNFTTTQGSVLNTLDSIWVETPILYSNPDPTNPVFITLAEGALPPGLEINDTGLIRGYANPPVELRTLPPIVTSATTTETTNFITCLSTIGFTPGRPVTFTGTSVFGGVIAGDIYYIRTVESSTQFTISTTQNGSIFLLNSGTGFMTVTLPAQSIGQPAKRTYSFTLKLNSPLGNDVGYFSITVTNQNLPTSQNGPGRPINTRVPVILNTRPATFNLTNQDLYYGYYVLPPADSVYDTYPPSVPAFIGTAQSENYFAFKIIGEDFDGNTVKYSFAGLPPGLVGDANTGWITGTPVLSSDGINQYSFQVATYKVINNVSSGFFKFSFNVAKNLTSTVAWLTPNDLGQIFNGTVSTKSVAAVADVPLNYRITSGALPPNLTLLSNGEITGYVADQPTDQILVQGDETVFTATIQAYSTTYPAISSQKTFTITVIQQYATPTDTLYIKATPSVADRLIINSLLDSTAIIPDNYVYRPNDQYFGKASSVIYEHAYGIFASGIDQYIAAITKNHYWRNITLGSIETAIARDAQGNIIYEVVYSRVIDNLINPQGISVGEEIAWPRTINLFLGPWYTSITDIYTSYVNVLGQDYYTSLTPGSVNTLYPNSLPNMRTRVGQELGQEFDSTLLPAWMNSQQLNGSTLGYTQAWVICYCKPRVVVDGNALTYAEFDLTNLNKSSYKSYAEIIKYNIENLWKDPVGENYKLNRINFKIDRFSVDKSLTYNYDNATSPPAWTDLPSGTPVPDPIDSKDFYVLFPRKTILPDKTQY